MLREGRGRGNKVRMIDGSPIVISYLRSLKVVAKWKDWTPRRWLSLNDWLMAIPKVDAAGPLRMSTKVGRYACSVK